jgi:hypothetical protein
MPLIGEFGDPEKRELPLKIRDHLRKSAVSFWQFRRFWQSRSQARAPALHKSIHKKKGDAAFASPLGDVLVVVQIRA